MDVKEFIDSYENFPKDGVLFRDIGPVLSKPLVFQNVVDIFCNAIKMRYSDLTTLVAIDARGFIFGAAAAYKLGVPLVMARKKGKLPGNVVPGSYRLEYGEGVLEIQREFIENGRVVIIDDLLATGGTINCVKEIVDQVGGKVLGSVVLIELLDCNGRASLKCDVTSVIQY